MQPGSKCFPAVVSPVTNLVAADAVAITLGEHHAVPDLLHPGPSPFRRSFMVTLSEATEPTLQTVSAVTGKHHPAGEDRPRETPSEGVTMPKPGRDGSSAPQRQSSTRPLPVWRIGIAGGLVGILCCVGPAVLALLGLVSAGTAYLWATDLYRGYQWWFRLAGLGVMALLIGIALRKRNQCTLGGARTARRRLLTVLAIAVATYLLLYATTTWLGRLAA